jgi:hypothetical protein
MMWYPRIRTVSNDVIPLDVDCVQLCDILGSGLWQMMWYPRILTVTNDVIPSDPNCDKWCDTLGSGLWQGQNFLQRPSSRYQGTDPPHIPQSHLPTLFTIINAKSLKLLRICSRFNLLFILCLQCMQHWNDCIFIWDFSSVFMIKITIQLWGTEWSWPKLGWNLQISQ